MATKEENINTIKTLLENEFGQDAKELSTTTELKDIITGKEENFIQKLKDAHDVDISLDELNKAATIEGVVSLMN